jgi:hypothetical protein
VTATYFKGRRAATIENDVLRVTVLREGGHIAEVFDKRAGVSPLWIPRWETHEPSAFSKTHSDEFGPGDDAKLLAGIMGHNLCLDIFGGPSREESAAGLTVHGEGSVDNYEMTQGPKELKAQLTLTLAQLEFSRVIQLQLDRIRILESIRNLSAIDRPLAWTQHVTLGRPFLDPATTEFRVSMTRSVVAAIDPGNDAYLKLGKEFEWPLAPDVDGGYADLRRMKTDAPASSYTAHLADPGREHAYFVAHSPEFNLAFGYIWKRADFPWLGIWEENCSRQGVPWRGQEVTRGMEFGVSPFPETRREMVERNKLFATPTYRWIPGLGRLEAEYWIVSHIATAMPESIAWPKGMIEIS